MNRKRSRDTGYQKRYIRHHMSRGFLIVLEWIIIFSVSVAVWLMTHRWSLVLVIDAGFVGLAVIAALQHRVDDRYISDIIAELAKLIDALSELTERDIFPDNEDTLVSKLQNKLVKLVKALRKKRDMAERDKENVKALVSDLSHQLKTPIANLRMYMDFLQDETLSEDKKREYMEVLRISVDRLSFLAESMIKISRLESGLIHLHGERQSLNETAMQAVKAAYSKAKSACVEIRYENTEEQDIVINHDRNWTAEAIFNLLDNGIKYAPDREEIQGTAQSKLYEEMQMPAHFVLTLRLRRLGTFAVVEVEDENGSIPEDEQTKIFARFYRGKNSQNKEGIGVGLYLSREIAVRQGGYMNLKTTSRGNIFSIYFYDAI